MIANYHTHTFRCQHALGSEEQYIRKAIAEGLSILGFSDHTPQPYGDRFVSSSKMGMAEMPNYFRTLTNLREKFKDKITIRIGFEAEYYPAYWDRLIDAYRQFPLEYLILGQHYIDSEFGPTAVNSFVCTRDKHNLTRYVDQMLEAMGTGRFTYVAHPDVFYYDYKEDTAFYRAEMRRLIRGAKEMDLPLELNLLGLYYNRHYPVAPFWEEVAAEGNRVILGCDAHIPDNVANPRALKMADDFVAKYGLHLIDTVELVNPLF